MIDFEKEIANLYKQQEIKDRVWYVKLKRQKEMMEKIRVEYMFKNQGISDLAKGCIENLTEEVKEYENRFQPSKADKGLCIFY